MSIFNTLIATVAALIVPAIVSVDGAKAERGAFAEQILKEDTHLKLVGVGLFRYWGMKAYKGAFYLESGADRFSYLDDNAKRIELQYMRPIKGEDFGRATSKSLNEIVDKETLERLRSRIDYHNSLYQDVEPGDRYSLTYIPGVGTELALNGQAKGLIKGADFAAAIFSIWIGPKPISESFKNQILGFS